MSAAQVMQFASWASSSLPLMHAAKLQQKAHCASANCVAIKHVSVGVSRMPPWSCSMNRVTATLEGKQQQTSQARHSSGAFCSPHCPLQGKAPPQQT